MGMAMLAAVPLLSLVLIRMLWSGSSLWFLTFGIIFLGSAAVVFLARRPQDEYGRTLAQEPSRVPLVLAALGVLFLAMLLLPNFADSDSDDADLAIRQPQEQQQQPPAQQLPAQSSSSSTDLSSEVSGVSQPPAQQPPAQAPDSQASPQEAAPPTGSQTYVVADGDTLWDIADRFGTTVEAIVAANSLSNASDLQIGQELIIPPPEGDDSGAVEESAPVGDEAPASGQ